MKIIKYNLFEEINIGTEEEPIIEKRKGAPVEIHCNEDVLEANEAIAKAEAYNGEPTIEDDGQEETYQPTIQEQLDAQAAAILELMGVNADD